VPALGTVLDGSEPGNVLNGSEPGTVSNGSMQETALNGLMPGALLEGLNMLGLVAGGLVCGVAVLGLVWLGMVVLCGTTMGCDTDIGVGSNRVRLNGGWTTGDDNDVTGLGKVWSTTGG
jgi:hypothetical protein